MGEECPKVESRMSSIPPVLHAFWSSPVVTTRAFAFLHDWSEIVHLPMPEGARPPRPASHISAAVRRVVDAPPPLRGPDAVADALEVLQDRREYCGAILRFCVDRLADVLAAEGQSGDRRAALDPVKSWSEDVGGALALYNEGLAVLRTRLTEAERGQRMPADAADWILQVAERLYTRLFRAHAQVERVMDLLEDRLTPHAAHEVRRRLSWILGLREFSCPFDWDLPAVSRLTMIPEEVKKDRFETGMILLDQFRLAVSKKELALYERAAQSSVRNRDIAFDLDRTLGDMRDRSSAMTEIRKNPERYDADFEDVVHQFSRMRIPYRGVQALLLGLWAAGNRLRVYSTSGTPPETNDAFFNDFPLLKVACGLASPERAGETISSKELHASNHYMDGVKQLEFWRRHFGTNDGRLFLEMLKIRAGRNNLDFLKDGKIPFPDFPFDVLVEESPRFAEEMRALGFGPRWIEAPPTAAEWLQRLEAYFAKPLTDVSDNVFVWLETWEIS